MTQKNSSWDSVSEWYDEYLEVSEDSFQKKVILPNILRIIDIKKGDKVLDLACGQGFFSREFYNAGAEVSGVDISPKLIEIAKTKSPKDVRFEVASADKLSFIKDGSFDRAVIILALQNIENLNGVIGECSRVLKKGGRFIFVLNHPVFRLPKKSSWGWDDENKIQYRRLDSYLSEYSSQIEMHPGERSKEHTISFHRSLQVYLKALIKNGFCLTNFEEWISHKKSEPGPRAKSEDTARKEFPMFLCIGATKLL
ncbi:MAG: class I SAM-dependent methyltransferase [Candidatus Paceibacterota bacterium]